MFFFNFGSDRDVRDRQDGKDKGLHRADEEPEQRPERFRQPREPGWDQYDDQRQQELAHENIEVEPEGERDRLGQLIDDRQGKVGRYQEQVLEVTTEVPAAD